MVIGQVANGRSRFDRDYNAQSVPACADRHLFRHTTIGATCGLLRPGCGRLVFLTLRPIYSSTNHNAHRGLELPALQPQTCHRFQHFVLHTTNRHFFWFSLRSTPIAVDNVAHHPANHTLARCVPEVLKLSVPHRKCAVILQIAASDNSSNFSTGLACFVECDEGICVVNSQSTGRRSPRGLSNHEKAHAVGPVCVRQSIDLYSYLCARRLSPPTYGASDLSKWNHGLFLVDG